MADAFAADPLLATLSGPLREGTRAFAAGGVPLIDAVPDPHVCRRCGHVTTPEAPDACPRCGADGVTFLVQRPVWWLERYDPASAMAQLERTPARVRALLDRIPTSAWPQRPDPGTWSPHEVLSHLRDAQGVLEQRVEAILGHDDPDLEAKMVWWWNQEARPATTQEVLDAYLASRAQVLERLRGAVTRQVAGCRSVAGRQTAPCARAAWRRVPPCRSRRSTVATRRCRSPRRTRRATAPMRR